MLGNSEVEVAGIPLTEDQTVEFDDLLDACAGDKDLADEVWEMYHFSDGTMWLDLDAVAQAEKNDAFVASLEGEDIEAFDIGEH